MCRRIFKEQTSEKGDIPFYKIGTFGSVADAFISKELFEEYKSKYPYPKKGDILISASGSIGRTVEFTGKNEYFQDSNIVWLNHDERLSNAFLKYFYSVVNWTGIEGSTIKRLYNENILNTTINLPSIYEQNKMGDYFNKLDNLITLHQWKCCFCEKKGINAWEQRKLGEIGKASSGIGFPDNEQGGKEGIPFYKVSDMNLEGNEIEMTVSNNYVTEEQIARKKWLPLNDLPAMYFAKVGAAVMLNRKRLCRFPFLFDNNTMAYLLKKEHWDANFAKAEFAIIDLTKLVQVGALPSYNASDVESIKIMIPSLTEQAKIGEYFSNLDQLITLHQWKCNAYEKDRVIAEKQRKLEIILINLQKYTFLRVILVYKQWIIICIYYENILLRFYVVINVKVIFLFIIIFENIAIIYKLSCVFTIYYSHLFLFMYEINIIVMRVLILQNILFRKFTMNQVVIIKYLFTCAWFIIYYSKKTFKNNICFCRNHYFSNKGEIIMPELEALIEQKLIDQLVYGDSQWIYREDLKTEEDLWKNFKYILEQNNKDRLNGEPLSDAEFDQVKNQLQFSSFYKAGEWLVGENGKVMVHVQRNTEKLHLVVMNHEHIAGGSSVYEVINQYRALDTGDNNTPERDRRFDVTLMINGLPMIHIELKNKQHSYMDGFWQIKKYIGEGKFTGIFSAIQMFVISNGVDTKYFSAASDTELNPKFISGWLDRDNNPISDYLDFAKAVLRIPEAHEMIARYTVLDEDSKKLILLRPYQIHAIEAIRDASKTGKSGYVWHTTGSGKTLTSYKATRNLLMDIPSLDKTIFLIDRKDLDTQTTQAFQAYANNDLIDVDETGNVNDLKNKLKSNDRQVIVTTIQKLQRLITKRLQKDTPEYIKIKNLKIAFVVDECHRAVTPATKRELERFFSHSMWYGFTGTPRFAENPYPQLGDLPRTTEELYGERLHKYTIQNAIHDNAVLGFQVEHNGPKNMKDETDVAMYDNETHMLQVLDVILNKSYYKLGFQNGKGMTYEGILTTSSIQMAQKYYELLKKVKNGETNLIIDDKIKQVLPDFPKFAITYSVSENEEGSTVNQDKMKASLHDYNQMFGTKYDMSQIQGYNANLNKRLARKDAKYKSRSEQLDLVIVVDRLLTGFDAPCMSTMFIDRQPMGPHDLIQAFSRTNRIFDKNKTYGQIVTFQAPVLFKDALDNAVKLYSAGGTKDAIMAEWNEIESAFRKSLVALRVSASTPEEIPLMSLKEKKVFAKMFQNFDRLFAQLRSFTKYDDSMLEDYGITQEEYDNYAAHYKNVIEIIKDDVPQPGGIEPETPVIDFDYELMAYSHTKIDYEYIINLIQNIVTPENTDEKITSDVRQKKIDEIKQYIEDLRKENPKVADIMSNIVYEIELDENMYRGQSILNIIENTKQECINKVVNDFCLTWCTSEEEVMYAANHYRNGIIPNENAIKETADFTRYKQSQEKAFPKFKYFSKMMTELKKIMEEEIKPLLTH